MAQTMNNSRKTTNATARGTCFYNTVTGNIAVDNPKIIAVEWIDESGERATAVKYGTPVSLRVSTEDGARCSLILFVQCDDWRQEYVSITKIETEGVPYAPEATEETTITFTPKTRWLNMSDSASGKITAMVFLVWNKAELGEQDEVMLNGFVKGFMAGSIRLREFYRFREPVFFDSKEAETLSPSTTRVPIATLNISQKGIDFIKSWEKLRLEAYDDSEGYATIGYGHLIRKSSVDAGPLEPKFANGITEEYAEELLRQDLLNAERTLKRRVSVDLYQQEYDALVSLVYNMGRTDKAPKLFSFLDAANYDSAANEFRDITNGERPGLVIRRQDEINIFKNNRYSNHN